MNTDRALKLENNPYKILQIWLKDINEREVLILWLVGWLVIEVEQLFNVLKQWITAVPASRIDSKLGGDVTKPK